MGSYFIMSRLLEFFPIDYQAGEVFELKLVNFRPFSINLRPMRSLHLQNLCAAAILLLTLGGGSLAQVDETSEAAGPAKEVSPKTKKQKKVRAYERDEGSLFLYVAPRFFENRKLGTSNSFDRFGIPEVGAKVGFFRTSFNMEPVVGFSFQLNSSNTVGNVEANYQLYQVMAGVRQYGWNSHFLPIVPYLEILPTYSIALFSRKTSGSATKINNNGGELGAWLGGGFTLSFAAFNPSLRNELESIWNLKDYGVNFQTHYYPGGILRSGSFGSLSTIRSWNLGGGFFINW